MINHLNDGCQTIAKLHRKFIKGTPKHAVVKETTVVLCNLTNAVRKACNFSSNRVYISSRSLKHAYDKRPASEYDFFLKHLPIIAKYPNQVFRNESSKRGSFVFVKKIDEDEYLVSLESVKDGEEENIFIVTMFGVEPKYYKKFTLMWYWRGGNPSS